jgi:phage-related baseplate assembly protein
LIDYNFNKDFLDADPDTIEKKIIALYEKLAKTKLSQANPLNIFFKVIIYIIVQLKMRINFNRDQNFVDTSEAPYLDKLGRFHGTNRLSSTKAITTLRFYISAEQTRILTIPAGVRATPGNNIYFKTLKDLEIKPGEMYGDVNAECTEFGTLGNDFGPGEINVLVDPFQYYLSLENLTKSAGGSDEENDDNFKERVWDAPLSYSTCGPKEAYRYWAKSASPLVVDAGISTPEPGHTLVIPVLANGALPTQDILDLVYKAISPDDKRPNTDFVRVEAPKVVNYDIEVHYWINKNEINAIKIQKAVENAVKDFILWQRVKLGRDVNPSKLIELIIRAGAKRVEVIKPLFFMLEEFEIAINEVKNIHYEGLEDD